MNRTDFMQRLRKSLGWHFSQEEIQEILSDYEEFYSVGIAEGKSEQELSQQFGNPKEIAIGLIKEKENEGLKIRAMARNFLLNQIASRTSSRKSNIFAMACHVMLLVIAALCYFLTVRIMVSGTFAGMTPKMIGLVLSFIVCVSFTMSIIALLYSVYLFFRHTVKALTLTCHALASLVFLKSFDYLLHDIGDASSFYANLNGCLFLYMAGVLITVSVHFYISLSQKKRVK